MSSSSFTIRHPQPLNLAALRGSDVAILSDVVEKNMQFDGEAALAQHVGTPSLLAVSFPNVWPMGAERRGG